MPVPSDEDLVEQCLRNNQQAWELFVERFSKLVYWSIQQILEKSKHRPRQDLCEDIFQEVFQKLLEREVLEKVEKASRIRKFLVVLTTHLTLDRIKRLSRQEKRQVFREASIATEACYLAEPSAAAGALDNERNQIIAEVLASLPARERACLELCYLDDKTHEEIGWVLGMPTPTVSTVIKRTREKLQQRFEQRQE